MKDFQGDPALLRQPCAGFDCREINEEETEHGSVAMLCRLPNGQKLEFHCRDRSIGVLVGDEPVAKKIEAPSVDPFFFDPGYYLAGKTGFQVWPGSRLITEALTWPQEAASPDSARIMDLQNRVANGARLLELGAGTGLVGATLAAAGGQVLITDLPTLVTNAVIPNLERNKKETTTEECPTWLESGVRIGRGWAGTAVLDWTVPLEEQLSGDSIDVDFIVACDCLVWKKVLDHVLTIITKLFAASKNAKLLMSYQKRDKNTEFTDMDNVLSIMADRGWTIECLAWRPVNCGEDGTKEYNDLFFFEVSPGQIPNATGA